jgi:hypothetical protein
VTMPEEPTYYKLFYRYATSFPTEVEHGEEYGHLLDRVLILYYLPDGGNAVALVAVEWRPSPVDAHTGWPEVRVSLDSWRAFFRDTRSSKPSRHRGALPIAVSTSSSQMSCASG